MQGAAGTPLRAFPVELGSDLEGVGIHLDHRAERGPGPVELLNSLQVSLAKLDSTRLALCHGFLQRGDTSFLHLHEAPSSTHSQIRRSRLPVVYPIRAFCPPAVGAGPCAHRWRASLTARTGNEGPRGLA